VAVANFLLKSDRQPLQHQSFHRRIRWRGPRTPNKRAVSTRCLPLILLSVWFWHNAQAPVFLAFFLILICSACVSCSRCSPHM